MADSNISRLHKATDVVPKFTGCLSLLGSLVIQRELYHDFRRGRHGRSVWNRTLFALCFADYALTLSNMLTSLPIPADEENVRVWGNIGTRATCVAQGTLFSFGLWTSSLLNLHLGLTSLLIVRYNWTEKRLKQYELLIHSSTWLPALVIAIFPIPLGLYNPAPHICWLHAYPFGCNEQYKFGDEGNCIRGENGSIYNLVYVIIPMWPCMLASLAGFRVIYLRVRRVEDNISRYNFARAPSLVMGASSPRLTATPTAARSRKVAYRAMWFLLSFFMTYSLSLVRSLFWLGFDGFSEWLAFFNLTVYVIQGFFNLLAFMRGRRNMQTQEGKFLRYVLFFEWVRDICPVRGTPVSSSEERAPSSRGAAVVEHESPQAEIEVCDRGGD